MNGRLVRNEVVRMRMDLRLEWRCRGAPVLLSRVRLLCLELELFRGRGKELGCVFVMVGFMLLVSSHLSVFYSEIIN